jgi:DNA polymerase I-like protein with 3'-5' exonuclease and polymerase domains
MYTDREKRQRRKIYRGIVANNTTQGSSARILMAQMRRLRDEGIIWAGTVHDELIFLVPSCDLEDWCSHIEQGMRFRPDWASRTPIDCELTVGRNYADQYDLDLWLAGGRTTLGAEAEKQRRKSAAMTA